jgi:hypothetical protein
MIDGGDAVDDAVNNITNLPPPFTASSSSRDISTAFGSVLLRIEVCLFIFPLPVPVMAHR